MVVTITSTGYIKRVPLSTYALRKRREGAFRYGNEGGRFCHNPLCCQYAHAGTLFSTLGMVYKLKVYRLPEASPQSKGKALVNMLPLQAGETIAAVMPLPKMKPIGLS